jgi:hypothetical protein
VADIPRGLSLTSHLESRGSRVKQLEQETNHEPQSSAKVKMVELHLHSPRDLVLN